MKRYVKSKELTNPIRSRIIVCGGRHYSNYDYLEMIVDATLEKYDLNMDEVEFVSGHCAGADILGELYAKKHNIRCTMFPAEWEKYGRPAGPIRNSQMIEYASEADIPIVIAFVSPRTKGTIDTVQKARRKGFGIIINEYNSDNK